MLKTEPLSKTRQIRSALCLAAGGVSLLAGLLSAAPSAGAAEAVEFKKNETGLYRDIFDQNVYYEGTSYLRLERIYNTLFFKKERSRNLNLYDEVPDSPFFANRHARKRLSAAELERGYRETDGPDMSGDLLIVDGKFEGLLPHFIVKDAKGDQYLLKFDPADNLELVTSA